MATNGKEEETKPIVFYQEEENLQKLCNFLRSKEGPPVREAIEMDKRVHYLKGEY
jgi:translocation protein SEC62